ncbi:MAG: ORF6N domain-containing protein [Acidobacteria bacterium]|nr:ORF6N domain-containing protein [Acidobacteriota bacterium]
MPVEAIQKRIFLVRGQKVMLDSDLAELYGVTTGNLNLAVRRNPRRFPPDFMFRLTQEEARLILQFAISIVAEKQSRGGRRHLPFVFTEQGVAMLSSVLNSDRAIQVNITIMRAFVQSRAMAPTQEDLSRRIAEIELAQRGQGVEIEAIFQVIDEIKRAPGPERRFGFRSEQPASAPPAPSPASHATRESPAPTRRKNRAR